MGIDSHYMRLKQICLSLWQPQLIQQQLKRKYWIPWFSTFSSLPSPPVSSSPSKERRSWLCERGFAPLKRPLAQSITTLTFPTCSTTSPIILASGKALVSWAALSCEQITTIPMPILNTRYISCQSTLPRC